MFSIFISTGAVYSSIYYCAIYYCALQCTAPRDMVGSFWSTLSHFFNPLFTFCFLPAFDFFAGSMLSSHVQKAWRCSWCVHSVCCTHCRQTAFRNLGRLLHTKHPNQTCRNAKLNIVGSLYDWVSSYLQRQVFLWRKNYIGAIWNPL